MYLMKGKVGTTMLHVRVPQSLLGTLKEIASRRNTDVSSLVRDVLEYEAAHPALLPKPAAPIAERIKSLAARLGMKPAELIDIWIEEKLSEQAFEEDGLETDRVFSLEERFDLLLQRHERLAGEIRRTRSTLLAAPRHSGTRAGQSRKKTK